MSTDHQCFGQICAAHALKLIFLKFRKSSDIVSEFSDLDFLKEISNLAIRRRSRVSFSLYRSKSWHISISGLFDL